MPTFHQSTNKYLARWIFQTISCAYNCPGSGRNSQCWIASVLPSTLRAQGYIGGWKVPPLTPWATWLSDNRDHSSQQENWQWVWETIWFSALPPLSRFFISSKGSVSHFYKQVSETQQGTVLSESLQSGSNTAARHLCQKKSVVKNGTAQSAPWAHASTLRSLRVQRMYLSVFLAQISSLEVFYPYQSIWWKLHSCSETSVRSYFQIYLRCRYHLKCI